MNVHIQMSLQRNTIFILSSFFNLFILYFTSDCLFLPWQSSLSHHWNTSHGKNCVPCMAYIDHPTSKNADLDPAWYQNASIRFYGSMFSIYCHWFSSKLFQTITSKSKVGFGLVCFFLQFNGKHLSHWIDWRISKLEC